MAKLNAKARNLLASSTSFVPAKGKPTPASKPSPTSAAAQRFPLLGSTKGAY